MTAKNTKEVKSRNNFVQKLTSKFGIAKIPIIGLLWRKWTSYKRKQKDLQSFRNYHDDKENKETSLPSSEKIEIHCAWITEAYAPSDIKILITSIRELGWDIKDGSNPSLTEWILENRNISLRSSWINGGIIQSHKDKNIYVIDAKHANLPPGVDYARLSIRNVTFSLTLLTIQFVFNDKLSNSFNDLFNQSYKTQTTEYKNFITYVDVIKQKRESIKNRLDKIHTDLYLWMGKNIPGHFAFSKSKLPTVDLITSRLYKPTKSRKSLLKNNYIDLLFDYSIETWSQKDNSNLELRISQSNVRNSVPILFGNYDALIKDSGRYGLKDRSALTNKLNMYFGLTTTLLAIHNLLLDYEYKLSVIRDKATSKIGRLVDIEAYKNLNDIRRNFVSLSTNVQNICEDLVLFINNKNMYFSDTIDFTPPSYFKGISDYSSFLELLRKKDEAKIEQLNKLEPRVTKAVSVRAELTSALANLRVQWAVLIFTAVVTIFTIVGFYRSDPQILLIEQKLNHLISMMNRILNR